MSSQAPFDAAVTFLYCADLERSTAFYRDLLGLALVLDQGSCRIFQVSADGYLGFCAGEQREPQPDAVIVTLVCQDVDARVDELVSRGLQLEKAPQHNETYNIYHCFFRDPDGHLLEIQRFDDPAWPGNEEA